MGALGWQDLAVALAASGALGWLIRRWWLRRRRPAACEECPACDPSGAPPGRSTTSDPAGTLIPESELKRR